MYICNKKIRYNFEILQTKGKKIRLKTDKIWFRQFYVGTTSCGLIFVGIGDREEKENGHDMHERL
jgi:hypothetical protein